VKKSVNQLIFAIGVLVVWEALALLKLWPPYVFPTPRGVAETLWAGLADHSIFIGIAVSLRRVALGYAISVVLGILLGVLLTVPVNIDAKSAKLVIKVTIGVCF